MTVLAELVRLPTPSTPIDGLLYPVDEGEPVGVARAGAMILHGTSKNFYRGPSRFLPPFLVELGVETLACNRRDHDVLATIGRDPEGGAFQTYAEGLEDADSMARFLATRGHAAPVVVGHSNGGLLAAAYAAEHPVRALILLSAHAGGPQSVARDSAAGLIAQDRVDEFTERARRMVAEGRGDEFLLLPSWWYLTTARSFLDRAENSPDLLTVATRLRCPVLVLRGEQEDESRYPVQAVAERAGGPTTTAIIEGADHHYGGREEALAEVVVAWLREELAG